MNQTITTKSILQLFSSDYTDKLLSLEDKSMLIINSRNEYSMFRQQSEYIRRTLKSEKSIYLKGTHDDFILKPNKELIHKIFKFIGT